MLFSEWSSPCPDAGEYIPLLHLFICFYVEGVSIYSAFNRLNALATFPIVCIGNHPRSCGKDGLGDVVVRDPTGSPPLVRERLQVRRRAVDVVGITPARARKTTFLPNWVKRTQDHPRSCGKDGGKALSMSWQWESPPLVRERRAAHRRQRNGNGITPARAGMVLCQVWVQVKLRFLSISYPAIKAAFFL